MDHPKECKAGREQSLSPPSRFSSLPCPPVIFSSSAASVNLSGPRLNTFVTATLPPTVGVGQGKSGGSLKQLEKPDWSYFFVTPRTKRLGLDVISDEGKPRTQRTFSSKRPVLSCVKLQFLLVKPSLRATRTGVKRQPGAQQLFLHKGTGQALSYSKRLQVVESQCFI